MDVSVLIPARNEVWLAKTIENILENIEMETEIIAVLDGYWPIPPIKDNPRVIIIHHTTPIGQRAAVNEAARLSQSKFIMKLDGHSAVEKGFDRKLIADCEYDWTVIPRMYNLHAFDWRCLKCGATWYQGPDPQKCQKCDNTIAFEKVIFWRPKLRTRTDFARFDSTMHFQYWKQYEKRKEAQGEISDVMSSVGASFFMHRERFFELGGLDEKHGFWGQFGTEISCKSWLSGGRQVVNKKTWFSHMFRTQFGFPYHITGNAQERAREYSRWLWKGNNWSLAKRPLNWIIEKFAPVPTWE